MKPLVLMAAFSLSLGLAACATDRNASAPAATGASGQPQTKDAVGDAVLTGKVKAALAADVGLKTWDIDVDSYGNTVTLTGVVDTEATKRRIEQVARDVEGVATVRSNISVKGG